MYLPQYITLFSNSVCSFLDWQFRPAGQNTKGASQSVWVAYSGLLERRLCFPCDDLPLILLLLELLSEDVEAENCQVNRLQVQFFCLVGCNLLLVLHKLVQDSWVFEVSLEEHGDELDTLNVEDAFDRLK